MPAREPGARAPAACGLAASPGEGQEASCPRAASQMQAAPSASVAPQETRGGEGCKRPVALLAVAVALPAVAVALLAVGLEAARVVVSGSDVPEAVQAQAVAGLVAAGPVVVLAGHGEPVAALRAAGLAGRGLGADPEAGPAAYERAMAHSKPALAKGRAARRRTLPPAGRLLTQEEPSKAARRQGEGRQRRHPVRAQKVRRPRVRPWCC